MVVDVILGVSVWELVPSLSSVVVDVRLGVLVLESVLDMSSSVVVVRFGVRWIVACSVD